MATEDTGDLKTNSANGPSRPRPAASTASRENLPPHPDTSSKNESPDPGTVFRGFSSDAFHETASWFRLERILKGDGGCYGLYGPRGSGKSWLMLNAIDYADKKHGMGLWFPSPSEYDAYAFLSSLSDNLANNVERTFILKNNVTNYLTAARRILILLTAVPLALAIFIYFIRGISAAPISRGVRVSDIMPLWSWIIVVTAAYLLIGVLIFQQLRNNRPAGRLVREATALRERIRYTASLKYGAEAEVKGTYKIFDAAFKRSQEKALAERPTTIASLVFDFRNLVELVARFMKAPVVIGIDELDKMQDPLAARALLRDIKGIFEVTGVHFLVSVSDEAAAALQLGTLQTGGRNEFNSSFYTVIELPPLSSDECEQLLQSRNYKITLSQVHALCLISAGNQRELVRIADATVGDFTKSNSKPASHVVVSALKEESYALLREIISNPNGGSSKKLPIEAKAGAWRALPRESFQSVGSFVSLGNEAIKEYWEPSWSDDSWIGISESWKRLLVRMFVAANFLELDDYVPESQYDTVIADLLQVMIMAGQDAGVARLMLESRFGEDLLDQYRTPVGTI
jgi:hypothetical protein